jgi:hypothetical protein
MDLHIWGAGLEGPPQDWETPIAPAAIDDYGAMFRIALADPRQPVGFIVHRGDLKDVDTDRSFLPESPGEAAVEPAAVWLIAGDQTIYLTQPAPRARRRLNPGGLARSARPRPLRCSRSSEAPSTTCSMH